MLEVDKLINEAVERTKLEQRKSFLSEQYVMLGEIDEFFGRHSNHKASVYVNKKQREILKELEKLKIN